MKKIFLFNVLMLVVLLSNAQSPIMYRGDFEDGFSFDTTNSFTPNYANLAYYKNPYTGDDQDGFAMDGDMKFTPNYSTLQYFQNMYLGNLEDGFAFDTTSYSTPLPVTLLSFEGQALQNKNYLFWKTATEENVSHFELGKGKNGADFTNIAQVQAKGTSTVETNYHYNDYRDITGSNYYRLKIIDQDAQYSYSKVIRLVNEQENFSILLAPNPASEYLSIKLSRELDSQSDLKIVNAQGQIIFRDHIPADNVQHNLMLSQLSVGTYFIILSIEGEQFSLPFVKR